MVRASPLVPRLGSSTHATLAPCSPPCPPLYNAGRLAMIGIISFATAVAIPGSVPFYPL